jgi:DNA-binding cell septation regulator SpoVG
MKPKISSIRFSGRASKQFMCYASLMFDGNFVVRGIRVLKNKDKKILIVMPSRESSKSSYGYEDIAHPVNNEYRKWLELMIMKAYLRMCDKGGNASEGYEVKFREKRQFNNRKRVN